MRIAVVGAGRMGRVHLSVLEALPDVEVVAVVDPITPGATHVDVDALLADDLPDGAVVAAPSTRHLEIALQLLDAGVPTLCEKPCGTTAAEATTVFERSAKTGTPLQIGYWRRFVPALRSLRDRIEAGELGDVLLMRSEQWDERPPPASFRAESGGILIDMGVHELDQIRWLTGQELARPTVAAATVGVDPPVEGDLKASRRCSSSRAAGSPSRRSVAASRPATCAGSPSRGRRTSRSAGSSGRRTPTARSPTGSPRRTRRSSSLCAAARRRARDRQMRWRHSSPPRRRRQHSSRGEEHREHDPVDRGAGARPLPRRAARRARRRPSSRFFGGCFGIFGHGNVAGIGQALLQHPDLLPLLPGAERAGDGAHRRRYARMRNRLGDARLHVARSARARRTWSPAPRSRRSTGCRYCSLPGDVFAGQRPGPGAAAARGAVRPATSR